MILAGDIGGTKTALALYEYNREKTLDQVEEATFTSAQYPSLEAILEDFFTEPNPTLQAACFGVAGPVIDGRCVATNLPWIIEESSLATALRVPTAKLLNDLEATAFGMLHLALDEFAVLHRGAQPSRSGNMAVIAAGTGLGEAMLIRDGSRFRAIATEGGHASFAPVDDLQIALLRDLRRQFSGHVSFERVLSGPGLVNIYAFLRRYRHTAEPAWLTAVLQEDEPAPIISRHGVAGDDPVCREAIELFAAIYGAEAGNLALKCMGIGGVMIGGGIAPQILPVLQNGDFMRHFIDKGRFSDLLQGIEVKVALNSGAPLLGAAHTAAAMVSDHAKSTS
jgi:glucokinase